MTGRHHLGGADNSFLPNVQQSFMTKSVKCPHCGKDVLWSVQSKYRPFCSERCKLIDFGAWAKEEHTIAGDSVFDDVMSENSDHDYSEKSRN